MSDDPNKTPSIIDEGSSKLPEHVAENRAFWDRYAPDWVESGERNWSAAEPSWGIWGLPESQLQLLPEDMSTMQAIELGCGTGYVSAWMARRGARVVGIDNSLEQLRTARRLMRKHGVDLALLHGNAEAVPYPDASFDFAISEYGAAIWCDPEVWIPEAHRLLRPGGLLTFLGNHPLLGVSTPMSGAHCDDRLHRPYFGMGRVDWRDAEVDPGGIEFNRTISDWFRLFRRTGFTVEGYQELQAPPDAPELRFSVSGSWGRRWPSEQVWHLRKDPNAS
jgi:SAM-dependent methyltransferase